MYYSQQCCNWIKVAQLASVSIGDNVEIGAGTTIDRGTLTDTIIGNGVKLDNQIQIGHNVELGDCTAIAALPVSQVVQRWASIALLLVPLALLVI